MVEKEINWVALDDLELWKDNPNQGDLGAILNSISRFGYNETIAVWQGRVQGGNHRKKALHQLKQGGWVPGEKDRCAEIIDGQLSIRVVDVSHLETEQEANAFGLALNRTTRLGLDDDRMLAALLQDISAVDDDLLVASGYDGDSLDTLLSDIDYDLLTDNENGSTSSDGSLLAITNVTIDDPITQVEHGQVWRIKNHVLICADVVTEAALWQPFLAPGCWFLPYPGMYVTATLKAETETFVMVQPDTYIAGHIIDRFVEVHGESEVACD